MIKVKIPGFKTLEFEHLVLDFNGTLAVDGKLINGVSDLLNELSKHINIHVITADTFGTVTKELNNINCNVVILKNTNQVNEKHKLIKHLGANRCISIGNGYNDWKMLKKSALGILVLQDEGAAFQSIKSSSMVCKSINDALSLLLKQNRMIATLRR